MSLTPFFSKAHALSFVLLIVLLTSEAFAQQSSLGKVNFPTSGSEKAHAHFLRGLGALHSFWYEEALEEFRESTRVEPDFMMGYWGEAMALNHPLWGEQDTDAARRVLAKIKETPKLTARERAYLNALKALYGEGDKLARDRAYSTAMEKVYREYADDLEAASFYALSLLGTVRPDDHGYLRQMQAGAIALEVYQKNPDHPGAAHYIIHAFDDPEHAILALPAARRYAEIAPEAHHARHMPSHIFIQLGMWAEAAASNESAWAASEAWVKRKNLSLGLRDYHSLHWLLYVYLQQGRYSRAEELLATMRQTMTQSTSDNNLRPNYYANGYAEMASAFIVETERWELASKIFEPLQTSKEQSASAGTSGGHIDHGGAKQSPVTGANTVRVSSRAETLPFFVRGLAAAINGSMEAQASATVLQALAKDKVGGADDSRRMKVLEIRELQVRAADSAAKGKFDEGVEMMKKATALEESMAPPSGPPGLIKPSHELFGEILLKAGRHGEAAEQFAISLRRQPNRARSLLGAARAAAKGNDPQRAANLYAQLLRQWQHGDANLQPMREAQDFLKQASAR
jgi:hypothetical protein